MAEVTGRQPGYCYRRNLDEYESNPKSPILTLTGYGDDHSEQCIVPPPPNPGESSPEKNLTKYGSNP